jgi:hypothetical protein
MKFGELLTLLQSRRLCRTIDFFEFHETQNSKPKTNSNLITRKSGEAFLFVRSNDQAPFAVKTNVVVDPIQENYSFVLETNKRK